MGLAPLNRRRAHWHSCGLVAGCWVGALINPCPPCRPQRPSITPWIAPRPVMVERCGSHGGRPGPLYSDQASPWVTLQGLISSGFIVVALPTLFPAVYRLAGLSSIYGAGGPKAYTSPDAPRTGAAGGPLTEANPYHLRVVGPGTIGLLKSCPGLCSMMAGWLHFLICACLPLQRKRWRGWRPVAQPTLPGSTVPLVPPRTQQLISSSGRLRGRPPQTFRLWGAPHPNCFCTSLG